MQQFSPGSMGGGHRPGAAATELALLLPFLGLMFVAALDFGRVFHATQTLQACAQAGALFASGTAKTPSATGPEQAAKNAACAAGASLVPALQADQVTVTLDSSTATVSVAYDFPLLTPILGPGTVAHLTRTATISLAPVPGN
jgi:Flp pilus assembly protein TadG